MFQLLQYQSYVLQRKKAGSIIITGNVGIANEKAGKE